MTPWVPMVLAVSGFIKALQEYASWGPRHIAMSSAITELTMLTAFWESSSIVDKGLSSTSSLLVSKTEAAVTSVVLSKTSGRVTMQNDASDTPNDGGAQDKSSKEGDNGTPK